MIEKLQIFESLDAANLTSETIKKFEQLVDIELPELYKEFLLASNGGFPEFNTIWSNDAPWSINNYLFLENPDVPVSDGRIVPMGINFQYEGLKEIKREHLIPFACDPGGHLFCFDKKTASNKGLSIVLWIHDSDETIWLEKDFNSFVASLEREPDYASM